MAVDKLVDSTQLDADLTSVANAIRTKGGTSAQLAFPAGFVSAVQAIPTGVTPTGTKQISITQNGTTTEDVTNYASAQITANVPNTYAAGDEGKVVDDGALVAQTSRSIDTNGTYDTTLNNEVVVNVSGGGGTNFGITNTNSLSEMFYAIEHNMYSTGVVTVTSYFPKNVESEFCDTGYDGTLRGMVIFNEDAVSSSNTSGELYECVGFFGLAASQGVDQGKSSASCISKYRHSTTTTSASTGFLTTNISSRINSGKLYITPSNAGTTNTVFHTGHSYRWIAWGYDIIPD